MSRSKYDSTTGVLTTVIALILALTIILLTVFLKGKNTPSETEVAVNELKMEMVGLKKTLEAVNERLILMDTRTKNALCFNEEAYREKKHRP